MDEITLRNQAWLDDRFCRTDKHGIYDAHQPIYGPRAGHSEFGVINRYVKTVGILNALCAVDGRSMVDIGAAEGYKAFLARELLGWHVETSDLSAEACKRAGDLFGIKGTPGDVRALPFADEQFDVSLCSEVLEHVPNPEAGVRELLRISKKAVVITVPWQSQAELEKYKEEYHGHINCFSRDWFNRFGLPVDSRHLDARMLWNIGAGLELIKLHWPWVIKSFIALDEKLCAKDVHSRSFIFVLWKEPASKFAQPREFPLARVFSTVVPYFHLKK